MKENLYYSIACALGAAVIYFLRVQKYKKALAQSTFPTVSGRINSSTVIEKEHTTRNDDGSTDTDFSYTPKVTYTYEVNGKSYQNSRIAVLDEASFSRREQAEQFISSYPEGKELPIFYDPSDPKISFLNNQVNSKKIDFSTWILILLMMGGCIYFLAA